MIENYLLEKSIWDARVHAIAFLSERWELAFDIDYIFEWVEQTEPEPHYLFWVAPCTLVFGDVIDLDIDVGLHEVFTIDDLARDQPGTPRNAAYTGRTTDWQWTVNSDAGVVTFRATGYTMYVRTQPVLGRQALTIDGRGGISFERKLR